jgi:tetratricopeptide (TPR) repeat protein
MKGDEFVSWLTRATIWVEENSRTVLYGIGGAVLAAALVVAGLSWWRSSEEKAYTMLGQVQAAARAPLEGEADALPGAPATPQERAARVVAAADRMLRDYPRGAAARWARYHRAAALLDLERTEEAATTLGQVLEGGSGGILHDLARLLAGRIEEARGSWQKAAELYAAAAEGAGAAFPRELALFDQARCLASAGRKQDAITAFQKVVDLYPESPLASRASQRVQQLRSEAEGI